MCHTCHNSLCINPLHLCSDEPHINNQRQTCAHLLPKVCLKHPGYPGCLVDSYIEKSQISKLSVIFYVYCWNVRYFSSDYTVVRGTHYFCQESGVIGSIWFVIRTNFKYILFVIFCRIRHCCLKCFGIVFC